MEGQEGHGPTMAATEIIGTPLLPTETRELYIAEQCMQSWKGILVVLKIFRHEANKANSSNVQTLYWFHMINCSIIPCVRPLDSLSEIML